MAVKAANNAATLMIKQIGYAEKGMIFFLNKKDTIRPTFTSSHSDLWSLPKYHSKSRKYG